MAKFLLFILTFGFVIQCTGTAVYVKKSVVKSEQCPDDNATGEKNTDNFKIDKQQIAINLFCSFSATSFKEVSSECIQYYPQGFLSKPYLPPR